MQRANFDRQTRNSGVELLKVIGIILVIVSHVVNTVSGIEAYSPYQDYIVDIGLATANIQILVLNMLRYSASIGNTIFFVCSAWYLLDSSKIKGRKILQMLMDVWIISVVFLIVVYVFRGGDIGIKLLIREIFPTTFGNNWYITCYLLFYPIHPFLNTVIYKIGKSTLLKATLVMLFLYVGMNYLYQGLFNSSALILWITIYFAIAYMKLYLADMSNDIKLNICVFMTGFLGNCGIAVLTNILGLHMSFFSDKLLYWNTNCSPFILLMVIGSFNIARNMDFKNKAINYVSGLSMLIYIIHENLLLRAYYRPMMWQYVYVNFGYDLILPWTFVIALIVFLFGLISSIVYKCTLQKLVTRAGDALYPKLCSGYGRIEKIVFKLH